MERNGRRGNIGAVILAAGSSSRLGRPKQLLLFRGETLLRGAALSAEKANCSPIVVVLGGGSTAIENELQETGARWVINAEWERGIGTSIRSGVNFACAIDSKLKALVLLSCDQPFVSAATICALISEWEKGKWPIVAANYANTLGIPALFAASFFAALISLPDNSGAKALIESRSTEIGKIEFERGAVDIDTEQDYLRLTSDESSNEKGGAG